MVVCEGLWEWYEKISLFIIFLLWFTTPLPKKFGAPVYKSTNKPNAIYKLFSSPDFSFLQFSYEDAPQIFSWWSVYEATQNALCDLALSCWNKKGNFLEKDIIWMETYAAQQPGYIFQHQWCLSRRVSCRYQRCRLLNELPTLTTAKVPFLFSSEDTNFKISVGQSTELSLLYQRPFWLAPLDHITIC